MSIREDDLCGEHIIERKPEAADQSSVTAAQVNPVMPTAATAPATGARASGSVTASTSEARPPPDARGLRPTGFAQIAVAAG
jgi:hypothetical protein